MSFHHDSTALEVIAGHDLTGYNVIVTGSNSGIGVETARAMAKSGAQVFMTCRDIEKAKPIAEDIIKSTGNKNVHLEQLELDSLESVKSFVVRFMDKKLPLNILINNAGVMACPLAYTRDGLEMQFGTNHIGHFALTMGLLSCLKSGAKCGRKSRVVNVSSTAHARSDFDFEDYNFKSRDYDGWISYGQSKTANILFSIGLTQKFEKDGVVSNAVMPGVIFTNLQRHNPDLVEKMKDVYREKTIEAGASTSVWAACSADLEDKGGLYLENCEISREVSDKAEIYKHMFGYMPYTRNQESVDKLWDLSVNIANKN